MDLEEDFASIGEYDFQSGFSINDQYMIIPDLTALMPIP